MSDTVISPVGSTSPKLMKFAVVPGRARFRPFAFRRPAAEPARLLGARKRRTATLPCAGWFPGRPRFYGAGRVLCAALDGVQLVGHVLRNPKVATSVWDALTGMAGFARAWHARVHVLRANDNATQ